MTEEHKEKLEEIRKRIRSLIDEISLITFKEEVRLRYVPYTERRSAEYQKMKIELGYATWAEKYLNSANRALIEATK